MGRGAEKGVEAEKDRKRERGEKRSDTCRERGRGDEREGERSQRGGGVERVRE